MKRLSPLVALLAFVAACDQAGAGRGGHASSADSIVALNTQLVQARTVAAQQDSLMQGFNETTKLLAAIDSELTQVKGLKSHVPLDVKGESGSDPKAAYRASLLGKVQEVTQLLKQNRSRVQSLSSKNATLKGKLAEYEQTLASLQGVVDHQKQEITELTGRIDSLSTANRTLASEKEAVGDTVKTLRTQANTVYYIVGTKKDLIQRGIIVEEGSKFLFFGHKALVPARKIDTSAFTAMDKWSGNPITLHVTDKPFRVVSRQDPSLIEQPKAADGKPSADLKITDPSQFWGPSKFLIIVEG